MYSRAAMLLITMMLLLVPRASLAHRISVYAWQEGSEVHAEGYFADGSRCLECRVEVLEANTGELLLEGKTDSGGTFTFESPGAASIRVVVHAGPGHMGEYVLAKEDAAEAPQPPGAGEEALAEEARRKIDDLTKELRRLREEARRPGLTEIVGGIGWIVGILGLIAYLKSRKKR